MDYIRCKAEHDSSEFGAALVLSCSILNNSTRVIQGQSEEAYLAKHPLVCRKNGKAAGAFAPAAFEIRLL